MDLGQVYENSEVWINGESAGIRIAPPYKLSISKFLKPGENTIKVRVVNHLAHRQRDYFSMTMPMEPSGPLGPVIIRVR